MGANVHQPIAAVVAFVAGKKVAQLTDTSPRKLVCHCSKRPTAPPLVVNCSMHSVGSCDLQQFIRLGQLLAHGLFHLDMHARVRQDALAQRVVQLRRHRYRDNIRPGLLHHLIQVGEAKGLVHLQLIAELIQHLLRRMNQALD